MSGKHKILLVDDHPLVREWLAKLVNQEFQFEVCGLASSAREARQLLVWTQPDIAIVDITLEGTSGIELIKDIRIMTPKVACIVLSMHDEKLYAERAMRAGARGYVMKRDATKTILDAINTVLAGKTYFSAAINAQLAQKLAQGATANSDPAVAELSDRELEVLELLGRGTNTRQISGQLNLSPKTIQVYCGRIKGKLHLTNINELIAFAVRWQEREFSK